MPENSKKELQPSNTREVAKSETAKTLQLSQTEFIDLSGLSDEQINALKLKHADGMMELNKQALGSKIDINTLNAALTSFNQQTEEATKGGHSATIQYSHKDPTGMSRTEVIIGNTEHAATGKLTRSATGETDKTLLIIIVVCVALVVIAMIAMGK